jgi:hypothetical protein
MQRWYNRVQQIGIQKHQDEVAEYGLDCIYSFFQNCYHLRDWLEHSRVVSQKQLADFFRSHIEMQVCRDICNGTKHFNLTRPSVDAHFSIGREYIPANWPGSMPHFNGTWFIIAGSDKYDIFDLTHKCMAHWNTFLNDHGLL